MARKNISGKGIGLLDYSYGNLRVARLYRGDMETLIITREELEKIFGKVKFKIVEEKRYKYPHLEVVDETT